MLINIFLNTSRTGPEPFRRAEARRSVKSFALPTKFEGMMSDDQVPDHLVSEDMVDRYLALTPPNFSVIPEFQSVINEIEKAFVRGLYFSTVASACVAIERMLNLARIELHHHHPKIKELWGKGASNSWGPNIDALLSWGYLDEPFAAELATLYEDVRNAYLHSSPLGDVEANALRAANDAYKLIGIFLAFPPDLFRFNNGQLECLNNADPRFLAFYQAHLRDG